MHPSDLDRMPPNDPNAERWVLGSILLRPPVLDDLGFLREADFYGEANATIYRTLRTMRDQGEAIGDVKLVARRLQQDGTLERVGGVAALAEIVQAVPVSQHATHFARIVTQKAKYRAMRLTAEILWRDAQVATDEPEAILARTEASLFEVTTGQYDGGPVDFTQAVVEANKRIDDLQDRARRVGCMTGLADFDNLYGGLFPKELTILAARTGIGKTALATQIAMHNAQRGRLVYFVSLEMSRAELATRILCGQSGVNNRIIRAGKLDEYGRAAIVEASAAVAPAKLWIDDRPGMSIADIRRSARKLARSGLALVVVDYLQLVTPSDRRVPREQQVATITRELKQAARELDVPVLCLCQLNRQADQERPRLSHLRESGAIEQDADMVVFLYAHEAKQERGEDHNAVLEVAKYRHGESKVFRMYWTGATTSFACPDQGYSEFKPFA